jgi:polyphenol oxidase
MSAQENTQSPDSLTRAPQRPTRRDVLAAAGAAVGALTLPAVHPPGSAARADHSRTSARGMARATPFPFGKEPPRVRKSFADFSEEEVRALCNAVGYMRDGAPSKLKKPLSITSPLQWDNFAATHAHHCTETGAGVVQVHWSWFFLPWHRAYLFFLERHLAHILTTVFDDRPIKGAQFALPYWDWVNHKAMPNTRKRLAARTASPFFGLDLSGKFDPVQDGDPDPFNLALFDGYRGPTVARPEMKPENEDSPAWKNYTRSIRDYHTSPDQVATLLAIPNFCVFAGFPNIDRRTGMGLLESSPHNTVHDWVGCRHGNNRDMGTLRYAALDPVFCLHHANVDRIWSQYPYTPDPDRPPPTPDNCGLTAAALKGWGDQRFKFLDADGKMVSVTVRDTVKNMKNVTYTPPTEGRRFLAPAQPKKVPREQSVTIAQEKTRLTDRPARFAVKMAALPRKDRPDVRAAKPVASVLEIEVGDFYYSRRFRVRVFANKGDADQKTPLDDGHFIGSFQVLDSHAGPQRSRAGEKHLFFVNVSPGVSNFYKVAPPGKPFTLTLVPIGTSSDQKKFFLNVTRITLRVYD